MMQTYYDEIRKKRRASRIFWGLVFSFAFFLYFFFQGYYPAIDFSFREVFTTGGVRRPDMGELVKSFGIINISTTPRDASLSLGSGAYASNEKRMTSYGTYSLLMTRNDYVPGRIEFVIDRDTPYYIDDIDLLPVPQYTRVGTGMDHIANIRDNAWTAHTATGMVLMDETLSGGVLISSGVLTHIGEGYFLSGKTLTSYNTTKDLWEKKSWSGSSAFLEKCRDLPIIRPGEISCPKDKTLLTEKGKTYTGVTTIGSAYFRIGNTLVFPDETKVTLTGSEESSSIFLDREDTWYSEEGGEFRVLKNQKSRTPPLTIITGLEKIRQVEWHEGDLLVWGSRGNDTFLSFVDPSGEAPPRIIPFPDISLENLRIYSQGGNMFIKTKGALLFLYHNSDRLTWIVDGDILAVSSTAALYRKDGVIWRADWSEAK